MPQLKSKPPVSAPLQPLSISLSQSITWLTVARDGVVLGFLWLFVFAGIDRYGNRLPMVDDAPGNAVLVSIVVFMFMCTTLWGCKIFAVRKLKHGDNRARIFLIVLHTIEAVAMTILFLIPLLAFAFIVSFWNILALFTLTAPGAVQWCSQNKTPADSDG
ncbi:hypothetical protein [Natronoglycomyces albus]|uniref:Uncharacterized protein n=1 Tax=Natronoglycomyces albus TaxID=2811108 RepID=A0A895XJK8_9ACTN|nr:hypothetical protein [Natronoglycomyces albus]QSB05187.1 hypothetical protein JQS30_15745 [Natronoglycomyces albus]